MDCEARLPIAALFKTAGYRQALFTGPRDHALNRDLIAERWRASRVACRGYCATPNPVHLVLFSAAPAPFPEGIRAAAGLNQSGF